MSEISKDERIYRLANHIASSKNGLPDEWQAWADEIESDLRELLALRERAEPVYQLWSSGINQWVECDKGRYEAHAHVPAQRRVLYTAPPAPVVPMQPVVIDAQGTLRFKENPIVRKLLDYSTMHGYGLNEMALEDFDAEDRMQLAQLIGYSLSGYGTLSYVNDESYARASMLSASAMN
ncbi:hypothetical protein [Cronobacter malonaticus]|uniref:hypothetical protein n=1 Tax=Cronobacter malonaticus TaxID=413503 RepID=UPI0018F89CE4|nr:hypothetical protein [Cronobacter malonaticus]